MGYPISSADRRLANNRTKPANAFGVFILHYLEQSNISLCQFADIIGIDHHTISRHIRGWEMHDSTMEIYATYFDIPTKEIIRMIITPKRRET